MLRSHKRTLVSPEPVARRLPVGENEAHNMGDVCPVIFIMMDDESRKRKMHAYRRGWRNILRLVGRETRFVVNSARRGCLRT